MRSGLLMLSLAVGSIGMTGCGGSLQLTLAPIVDTNGQGGAIARIGGAIWLSPPRTATTMVAPHAAVEIGGLPGPRFPESRDAGIFGGGRIGVRTVRVFPKWLLSIDVDFPVLENKYRTTLVGLGTEVAFVPTIYQQGLHRRWGLGASLLTDVWIDPSAGNARAVFGIGFVMNLCDFNPQ